MQAVRLGKLRFRDTKGFDRAKGINVGDEWAYRSYITGNSPAAAIWTFENLREDVFEGDSLPAELTLGVYRTHKGVIERTVLGSISVRNPETGLMVETEIFESKEFVTQKLSIPKIRSNAFPITFSPNILPMPKNPAIFKSLTKFGNGLYSKNMIY